MNMSIYRPLFLFWLSEYDALFTKGNTVSLEFIVEGRAGDI